MLPYYNIPRRQPKIDIPPPPIVRSPIRETSQEVLTGYVQGKKASDLEERTARSHYTLGVAFTFRVRIGAFPPPARVVPFPDSPEQAKAWLDSMLNPPPAVKPLIPLEMSMNIPGELEIDFLTEPSGMLWPILVDGEIGHYKTDGQQELDKMKTDAINLSMAPYGAHAVVRVPYWKIATQEMSDAYYRNLYTELG